MQISMNAKYKKNGAALPGHELRFIAGLSPEVDKLVSVAALRDEIGDDPDMIDLCFRASDRETLVRITPAGKRGLYTVEVRQRYTST